MAQKMTRQEVEKLCKELQQRNQELQACQTYGQATLNQLRQELKEQSRVMEILEVMKSEYASMAMGQAYQIDQKLSDDMVQFAEKCAAKVRPTARGVYEDDIEEIEENVLPKKVKKKLHSAQQDWFEKLKAFQLPSAKCSVLHGSLRWLREEAQGWRIL